MSEKHLTDESRWYVRPQDDADIPRATAEERRALAEAFWHTLYVKRQSLLNMLPEDC